jgi:hypothetical protein
MEGRYANFFSVGYDAFVFIIDFGQEYVESQEPEVHSRIVTSPPYAKLLLATLRESLSRYEQTYIPITEPVRNSTTQGSEPAMHEPETATRSEADGRMVMPERPASTPPSNYPPPPTEPPRYASPEHEHLHREPKYPHEPSGGYEQTPPVPEPPAYPPPPAYSPQQPRKAYVPSSQSGYGHPGEQYPGHEHPGPDGGDFGEPPRQQYPTPEPPRYPKPEEPYGERPQGPPTNGTPPTRDGAPPRQQYPERQHPAHPSPEQPYGQRPQEPPAYGAPKPPGGHEPAPHGSRPSGYDESGKEGKPAGDEMPCPKPEDQLKELQRTLESQNKQIQALEKKRNSLKDDLTGLQQTVSDLAAIIAAYKEACKALNQQRSELDLYVQSKTPMLDAAVGDKKDAIEECIRSVDEWIDQWTCYADQLEPKAKAAAEAASRSAEAADNAQKTYDELKNSAKSLGEQLKALKELRDQIEQEDDKNNICRMYFLLKEFKSGLAAIQLHTPEELERQLCLVWTELSRAKEAARTARAEADSAREQADRAKSKAADATAKRRELVLECVDCACPPPTSAKPCC